MHDTQSVTIPLGNRTRVPGVRSQAWLKAKLTPEVTVTGGSDELVAWGDWGVACWMRLVYHHVRTGALIENRQAVRVPREGFAQRPGARVELICWGAMPSGMLRHRLFIRWL